MFRTLFGFFLRKDDIDKYQEQIAEAKNLISFFENKYNISSEEFISKHYSNVCLDVEAADANNWATLYLTIGKMV